MNANLFNSFWNFLHALPWICSPTEILRLQDAVTVVRFCHSIPLVVPCPYCSDSAKLFEKRFGLVKSLSIDLGDVKILTRARISNYWYKFHNQVNKKLSKPELQATWRDSIMLRPDWQACMWTMIYCVVWNYPEANPDEQTVRNVRFFFVTLFRVIRYTELGKRLDQLSEDHPLTPNTLKNRTVLKGWVYDIRSRCNDISGTVWGLKDLNTYMEGFRAREHNCKDGEQKSEKQRLAELNEPLGCK